jgi:hypothetical protein
MPGFGEGPPLTTSPGFHIPTPPMPNLPPEEDPTPLPDNDIYPDNDDFLDDDEDPADRF